MLKTSALRRSPFADAPGMNASSAVADSKHCRASTPASSSSPSSFAASDKFPGYTQNIPLLRNANLRPISSGVRGGLSESCDFADVVC
jgi:hypothetical protein